MTTVVQVGKLKGSFRGFRNQQTRFTFQNGAVWRQAEDKYHYLFTPNLFARVLYQNGIHRLEICGTGQSVQVEREN